MAETILQNGLTATEQITADAWLADPKRRAWAAYLEAKPDVQMSTAKAIGGDVLRRPHVQQYIADCLRRTHERYHITRDRIIEEFAHIAFFDPKDLFDLDGNLLPINKMPSRVTRALAGFKVETKREVIDISYDPEQEVERSTRVIQTVITDIKFNDKIKGLLALLGDSDLAALEDKGKDSSLPANIDDKELSAEQASQLYLKLLR